MIAEQTPFRGSVLAVTTGLIGKGLGFAGALMIAALLGATAETDLIFFCYNLILICVSFFTCFNNNVLVPQFITLKEKGQEAQGWGLIMSIGTMCFMTLLVILLLSWTYHPEVLSVISGFQSPLTQREQVAIQFLLPLLCLMYVNDLSVNIFQAYRNFTFTHIISIAQGLSMVLCVGLAYRELNAGSISLAYLLAHSMVFLVLTWFLGRFLSRLSSIKFHLQEFGHFFNLALPALILQVSQLLLIFVPDYLASNMEKGTLSAILNARRVFDLLPTLLIYPIVAVGYTRLCTYAARENKEDFTSLCLSLNYFLISLVLPLSLYLSCYSDSAISLLFGYGKYGPEALEMSAKSLYWLAPGAFALVTHSLVGRALVAKQRKQTFYAYALGIILGALIFCILLTTLSSTFGYQGIVMGTCAYQVVYLNLMSYFLLYRYVGSFSIVRAISRLISTLGLSVLCLLIPLMVLPPGGQSPMVEVPLSFLLLIISIAGFHWLFKTESYRFIQDRLKVPE